MASKIQFISVVAASVLAATITMTGCGSTSSGSSDSSTSSNNSNSSVAAIQVTAAGYKDYIVGADAKIGTTDATLENNGTYEWTGEVAGKRSIIGGTFDANGDGNKSNGELDAPDMGAPDSYRYVNPYTSQMDGTNTEMLKTKYPVAAAIPGEGNRTFDFDIIEQSNSYPQLRTESAKALLTIAGACDSNSTSSTTSSTSSAASSSGYVQFPANNRASEFPDVDSNTSSSSSTTSNSSSSDNNSTNQCDAVDNCTTNACIDSIVASILTSSNVSSSVSSTTTSSSSSSSSYTPFPSAKR